jgi:hypothetical protein
MGDRLFLRLGSTFAARAGLGLVLAFSLAGCAALQQTEDPCALANRDVSFQVLVQNSLGNVYNACLNQLRGEILTQWGEQ